MHQRTQYSSSQHQQHYHQHQPQQQHERFQCTLRRLVLIVGSVIVLVQFGALIYAGVKTIAVVDKAVDDAHKLINKEMALLNQSSAHPLDDIEKGLMKMERQVLDDLMHVNDKSAKNNKSSFGQHQMVDSDDAADSSSFSTADHYLLKTRFRNVHTAPLKYTTRMNSARGGDANEARTHIQDALASSEFAPLTSEAKELLKRYAHVAPSGRADLLLNDLVQRRSLRPEAADLLRRLQTINEEERAAAQGGKTKRQHGVVVVHPMGQLCNRLLSITSAFVLSLLSGRALVVDDTDFYCRSNDLFDEPGFEWTSSAGLLEQADSSPSTIRLENPESGPWDMAEPLLCQEYYSSASPSSAHLFADRDRAISVHTGQYIVPYMQRNPHYARALASLFPSGIHGGLFRPIALFLFRPLRSLLNQRDAFVKRHFAPDDFIVGLQVRAGGDFTGRAMSDADWDLYRDCGLAAAGAADAGRKKIKFFVATDTVQGRERAKQALGADRVVFGPGEFLNSNNPRGVQMALLDLLILEQCDDRVTTAWSTFGYFAAGRSGLPANIVVDKAEKSDEELLQQLRVSAPIDDASPFTYMGVRHKSDARKQCVRLPTQQPCFHHFRVWGAGKVSCSKREKWLEEEMLHGRYC